MLKQALLLREIGNRFLCTIKIDGLEKECYIPCTALLSKFIDIKGKKVFVVPTPNNKTKYSLYSLHTSRFDVLLNLSEVNNILIQQLNRRFFSFLGKRKNILKEFTIGGYKADIYLPETKTIVEIKTVLTLEKEALFPGVVCDRAVQQAKKLYELQQSGFKVCYIFVSLSPTVKRIRLQPEDTFTKAFIEGVGVGFKYYACSLASVGEQFAVNRKIELQF